MTRQLSTRYDFLLPHKLIDPGQFLHAGVAAKIERPLRNPIPQFAPDATGQPSSTSVR